MFLLAQAGDALSFMELGLGARPLGMGNVYGVFGKGPENTYWNPAGLASADYKFAFDVLHAELFVGTLFDSGVVSFNSSLGCLGVSYMHLGSYGISETDVLTDENGVPVLVKLYGEDVYKVITKGYFDLNEHAVCIAYGRKFEFKNFLLCMGLLSKFVYISLLEKAWGVGADVGTRVELKSNIRFIDKFYLSVVWRNIGCTPVRWTTKHIDLALNVLQTGFAMALFGKRLFVGTEVEHKFGTKYFISFRTGVEIGVVPKMVYIRAGYAGDDIFSVGAGLRVGGFTVNYAYILHKYIENTHRVSVGYIWR